MTNLGRCERTQKIEDFVTLTASNHLSNGLCEHKKHNHCFVPVSSLLHTYYYMKELPTCRRAKLDKFNINININVKFKISQILLLPEHQVFLLVDYGIEDEYTLLLPHRPHSFSFSVTSTSSPQHSLIKNLCTSFVETSST